MKLFLPSRMEKTSSPSKSFHSTLHPDISYCITIFHLALQLSMKMSHLSLRPASPLRVENLFPSCMLRINNLLIVVPQSTFTG